jgi:UDP-N-acetylmuramoylalanine--D-glutamate ligase
MPSPTSWADLRGRRVALWGLGVEGRANLRRAQALGLEPLLVDDGGGALGGRPVLGFEEALPQLTGSEFVVKSPGNSRYGEQFRQLAAAGPRVVGGLGLWLAGVDRSRVVCITGTKGKSTTTSIAGGLLTGLGQRHHIGGNLGSPPWDPAVGEDYDWWVVETSSYQALDVEVGPKVVAVTSLSEDHLPWHDGSAETYFRDKLSLCTRPGVEAVVADGGDPLLRSRSELLGGHVRWVERGAKDWSDNGLLLGDHNRRNAEIARQALVALGVPGADDEARLTAAFSSFVPLPHRLTPVADSGGVLFVDDSISTNALSALAAVASFPGRRVALLVGGLERDIDYQPLAEGLAGRPDLLVVTMPSNGTAIGRQLAAATAVQDCSSLEEAVRAAHTWAKDGGGVVLLSPAAASFDRYPDYRARGEAFAAAVRQLTRKAEETPPRQGSAP